MGGKDGKGARGGIVGKRQQQHSSLNDRWAARQRQGKQDVDGRFWSRRRRQLMRGQKREAGGSCDAPSSETSWKKGLVLRVQC
jgi:hypothetical protein